MPENNLDKLDLQAVFSLILVVTSGAIGGCAASFANRANDKKMANTLGALGYALTGIFGAIITFASLMALSDATSINKILLMSSLSGFATSIALAGTNVVFKFALKKLGLEIELRVKRKNED